MSVGSKLSRDQGAMVTFPPRGFSPTTPPPVWTLRGVSPVRWTDISHAVKYSKAQNQKLSGLLKLLS